MTTRVPYSMTTAPVNVRAYGAKGDGLTNDSAAIQAAINAAAGSVVFPKGEYLVNTGLTLPSNCYLDFEAGALLKAGTNSMTVLATTAGFKSGIKLRNVSIDGNTKTGVTALQLSNVQFNSTVENINVYRCTNGVVLDSVCIGVSLITPTMYATPNAIKILASNANTVVSPNIDNQVSGGGTGAGTGIYITGGQNRVSGGFAQGLEWGVYDAGEFNSVNGTYFELCSSGALRWAEAVGPAANDVFFFGEAAAGGDRFLLVANDTQGGTVMWPKMVQGNSTGGLFYAVNGNDGIVAHYADGGTDFNTALGTATQVNVAWPIAP